MSAPSDNWKDSISKAVIEVYELLPVAAKPAAPKFTVLAAFAAVIEESRVEILTLATGTKCASSQMLGTSGGILVDSHAEVLARRSLIRYLTLVLKQCIIDPNFEHNGSCPVYFCNETLVFKWKRSWALYLYSSDSPCGGAAIYERAEGRSFSGKKARLCDEPALLGDCDTAAGTSIGSVRLKPGRQDMPDRCRSHSVSCSDKISRWIYLGVQG
jgi:tRNA-specific adenosine deaminase 1